MPRVLSGPSDELSLLLRAVEKAVLECVAREGIHKDLAVTTLKYVRLDPSFTIGCLDHSNDLKKKIIKYYLMMRMFFASDAFNAKENERQKQARKSYNKRSKL